MGLGLQSLALERNPLDNAAHALLAGLFAPIASFTPNPNGPVLDPVAPVYLDDSRDEIEITLNVQEDDGDEIFFTAVWDNNDIDIDLEFDDEDLFIELNDQGFSGSFDITVTARDARSSMVWGLTMVGRRPRRLRRRTRVCCPT